MNRKLLLMRRKHAQTREYKEMNALRGIVKDGAGTTLSTKATERLVPANEGIAFPLGTMDSFTTYGGPANLLETVNTIGLPLYARQHLDEKGCWIDV